MKLLFALAISFIGLSASAQENVVASDAFIIEGAVKHSLCFTAHSADSLTATTLGDITTVNHKGEVRSVRKNVKGILLRDAIKDLLPETAKPKDMAAYYFVLTGADGYHFVLSYNEVFTTDNIYIVTESNGNGWASINDRIAILSLMQGKKGHVAMKGLARIVVQKAG